MNFDNNSHIISILENEKEKLKKEDENHDTTPVVTCALLIIYIVTVIGEQYLLDELKNYVFFGIIICLIIYLRSLRQKLMDKIWNINTSIRNFKNKIKTIENNSCIVLEI
jgi:hypothetical protein